MKNCSLQSDKIDRGMKRQILHPNSPNYFPTKNSNLAKILNLEQVDEKIKSMKEVSRSVN